MLPAPVIVHCERHDHSHPEAEGCPYCLIEKRLDALELTAKGKPVAVAAAAVVARKRRK